jgi:hypothetical protein
MHPVVHLAFLLSRSWPPYGSGVNGASSAACGAGHRASARRGEPSSDLDGAPEGAGEAARGVPPAAARHGSPGGRARATRPFYERPFLQLDPEVADDLLAGVQDPSVRGLPAGVGCVDQWVDAVDVLVVPHNRRAAVRAFLGAG